MKASSACIKLIEGFEGFRSKAYKAVKTEKYYTIGYGHYGADVKKGQTITTERAEELLKKDIETAEKAVNKYQSVYGFTQSQYDALVSFAFNVGNIDGLTAKGTRDIYAISNSFIKYVYSGGKRLNGLVNRRNAERELFNHDANVKKIAQDVIYGKYGNGAQRKELLKAAGYDPAEVQKVVNQLMKG